MKILLSVILFAVIVGIIICACEDSINPNRFEGWDHG